MMKTKPMTFAAFSFFKEKCSNARSAKESISVIQESYNLHHLFLNKKLIQQITAALPIPSAKHNCLPARFATTAIAGCHNSLLLPTPFTIPSITYFSKTLFRNAAKLIQWLYNYFIIQFIHIPFILQYFSKSCCFFRLIIFKSESRQR